MESLEPRNVAILLKNKQTGMFVEENHRSEEKTGQNIKLQFHGTQSLNIIV